MEKKLVVNSKERFFENNNKILWLNGEKNKEAVDVNNNRINLKSAYPTFTKPLHSFNNFELPKHENNHKINKMSNGFENNEKNDLLKLNKTFSKNSKLNNRLEFFEKVTTTNKPWVEPSIGKHINKSNLNPYSVDRLVSDNTSQSYNIEKSEQNNAKFESSKPIFNENKSLFQYPYNNQDSSYKSLNYSTYNQVEILKNLFKMDYDYYKNNNSNYVDKFQKRSHSKDVKQNAEVFMASNNPSGHKNTKSNEFEKKKFFDDSTNSVENNYFSKFNKNKPTSNFSNKLTNNEMENKRKVTNKCEIDNNHQLIKKGSHQKNETETRKPIKSSTVLESVKAALSTSSSVDDKQKTLTSMIEQLQNLKQSLSSSEQYPSNNDNKKIKSLYDVSLKKKEEILKVDSKKEKDNVNKDQEENSVDSNNKSFVTTKNSDEKSKATNLNNINKEAVKNKNAEKQRKENKNPRENGNNELRELEHKVRFVLMASLKMQS